MNYLLDTNILLFYLRDPNTKEYIEHQYNPFGAANNPIISIVTVGEIKSIALQNQWGGKRLRAVEELLNKGIIADIKYTPILEKYAEIDAFSQEGKSKKAPWELVPETWAKTIYGLLLLLPLLMPGYSPPTMILIT
ncbi:MAG: hypothetical protein IPJ74_25525 [Saprospiraceae bacterium]|nr:hypothetical protein [Saprospiraceae bacterium]